MYKLSLQEVCKRLTNASNERYTFELNEYKNTSQKVKCKCNTCGHEWYGRYGHLTTKKTGCPNCAKQIRLTLDEATQNIFNSSNGRYTFELLEYKNQFQKVKCKCNTCGYEWETSYMCLVGKKSGCVKCGRVRSANKQKLNIDIINQRLNEASIDIYTFELIDYKNDRQKIKCKCLKCNYEWQPTIASLIGKRKSGCPKCRYKLIGDNKRFTITEATQKLNEASAGRYTFELNEYKGGQHQKIKCKCNICGREWSAVFNLLVNNKTGCPDCGNRLIASSKLLTLDEAKQKLTEASNGRYTFELVEYKGHQQKIKCKCLKCGYEWETAYTNLVHSGSGCYHCCNMTSKAESDVMSYIRQNISNESQSFNNRTIIKPKELDFVDLKHNLAVEFNGVYWHSEQQGKDKTYHLNKTESCEKVGIKLFHIFSNEWGKTNEIWKSVFSALMGGENTIILHARKCEIKEIPNSVAKQFCDENHLQSGINSKVNIGAYHKSQLVAVMTFGMPRYNKNYEWELLRFCSLKFHRIKGIASKLLAYFKRSYEPTSIISYGNRRWCSPLSNVYQKMGFQYKGSSAPNYFYVKGKESVLYSRLQFQKHKLRDKLEVFDESLTEYENMLLNGYDRIWDCGNLIYEWKKLTAENPTQ